MYDKAYFDWFESRIQNPGIHFGIADAIRATFPDLFPVLEIGCGRGYLTRHLHNLYAGAVHGVDVSEYAIANPIVPGLAIERHDVASPSFWYRPHPLVVSWQLLEHMPDERAVGYALAGMGRASSFVQLHSIAFDRREDPTHSMIKPRAWWLQAFAEHGWFVDPLLQERFNQNAHWGPNAEIFVLRRS